MQVNPAINVAQSGLIRDCESVMPNCRAQALVRIMDGLETVDPRGGEKVAVLKRGRSRIGAYVKDRLDSVLLQQCSLVEEGITLAAAGKLPKK